MTLPDERTRAVLMARRFLLDLTNPTITPKIPKSIRAHARMLLRHYPNDYDFALVNSCWSEPLAKFVSVECPFSHPDKLQLSEV